MERGKLDLAIGLAGALAFHAGLAAFGAVIDSPGVVVLPERIVARTVHKEIVLPKPKPPPEPEEKAKKPPPEPGPPKPKPEPKPGRKRTRRRRQPKRRKLVNKQDTVPADEPAPLVLSKTYGAGEGAGVQVQTGDEDLLGDPSVAANERNTRPRADPDQEAGDAEQGAGPDHKVLIRHARPTRPCTVKWPPGAPAGRRVIEVRLLLTIGLGGRVTRARVLRSVGEPFDGVAREAMRRCHFWPGTRDGRAFVDRVPFVVEFQPGDDA